MASVSKVRGAMVAVVFAMAVLLSACGGGFSIQGTWKSVGTVGWGQAQPGAMVQFGDGQANLYSPRDTYAISKDGADYRLEVTGLLGGTSSFTVKVVDSNNIELYRGDDSEPAVVLKRVG